MTYSEERQHAAVLERLVNAEFGPGLRVVVKLPENKAHAANVQAQHGLMTVDRKIKEQS